MKAYSLRSSFYVKMQILSDFFHLSKSDLAIVGETPIEIAIKLVAKIMTSKNVRFCIIWKRVSARARKKDDKALLEQNSFMSNMEFFVLDRMIIYGRSIIKKTTRLVHHKEQ